MPAARPEPTLASTWYCAGGTATDDGFGDHVLLIANPTDQRAHRHDHRARRARSPRRRRPWTPTTATTSTTTHHGGHDDHRGRAAPRPHRAWRCRARRAASRSPARPRARRRWPARSSRSTAARSPSSTRSRGDARPGHRPLQHHRVAHLVVPVGRHRAGARELLVFMNPFPDDATVDIAFATDEGVRDTAAVPGLRRAGPQRGRRLHRRGRHPEGAGVREGHGARRPARRRPHPDLRRHRRARGHHARPRRAAPARRGCSPTASWARA